MWYAGSSITNGAGSPANLFVFFSMMPEMMIAAIPTKYALVATHALPPKNLTGDHRGESQAKPEEKKAEDNKPKENK